MPHGGRFASDDASAVVVSTLSAVVVVVIGGRKRVRSAVVFYVSAVRCVDVLRVPVLCVCWW